MSLKIIRNMKRDIYVFFFNDTATTEIYTLSLHDALPISDRVENLRAIGPRGVRSGGGAARTARRGDDGRAAVGAAPGLQDRKSTRLNSSHANISYAVFCLKKKIYIARLTSLLLC